MARGTWLLLATCLLLSLSQVYSYRYIGCFIGHRGNRDLPILARKGRVYVGYCDKLCAQRHQRYFGLRNSNECWCGSRIGRYPRMQEEKCSMGCSGSSHDTCGGRFYNQIYETSSWWSSMLPLTNCSQSSTYSTWVCSRAIDGNTNQYGNQNSCSHTLREKGWWMAKTHRLARITQIKVFNIIDPGNIKRLWNFKVTVDGNECGSYKSHDAFSVKTFRCNLVGSVVMVHNRDNIWMMLCEVQVFGTIYLRV